MVKTAGGEVKYLEYQKEALKKQWRIYRADSGSVSFIEANSPFDASELSLGQRIDNPFPQKDR